MRFFTLLAAMALIALVVPSRAQTPDWHLTATVAESCSCAIACRCNFGGEPDGEKCEGNRITSVEKGHYNGVDLSGVQLLVTFQMRTWSKIYISDKVSDEQMKAVEALLPLAFFRRVPELHPIPFRGAHAGERGPQLEALGHQRFHLDVGRR